MNKNENYGNNASNVGQNDSGAIFSSGKVFDLRYILSQYFNS
jgi:hypothetical protein